jgi:hypothetical protein
MDNSRRLTNIDLPHASASPQERALQKAVSEITMKIARPLVWHKVREPWPKRLLGGTCFIIRFDTGLVGITADHVVREFEKDKRSGEEIVCQLRTVPLDLTSAIIDRDADLDVATFRVTEEQLAASNAIELDCRSLPLPKPDKGREISLAGFPDNLQVESHRGSEIFKAFTYVTHIAAVGLRDIYAYDTRRDTRVLAAPELPDSGANLSGCSGGPVLIHVLRNGCHRWFPVGLIIKGPCETDQITSDDPQPLPRTIRSIEFDTLRFRRIDFGETVKTDGSIEKDDGGWLPPPDLLHTTSN